MLILGIETSCDETAVAILELTRKGRVETVTLHANLIASQHEVHTPYGGIVPELASRRHIEVLAPMVREATRGVDLSRIEGIAVTSSPGLVGSLLVGISFAKALAYSRQLPFVGVNHLEGHLNAPFLEQPRKLEPGGLEGLKYPYLGLIVSGGHTALYVVRRFGVYEFLGGTRDDAAGEAFDKVAKLMNLGYPGGPLVDRLARSGDSQAVPLPSPEVGGYQFSYSGLKTAVRNRLQKHQDRPEDLAASFQEIVVDSLIEKALLAAKRRRIRDLVVTGGVACNTRLKEKFQEAVAREKRRVFFPSPVFCTDNAAMIAYVGAKRLLAGERSPWSLNAVAHADLTKLAS